MKEALKTTIAPLFAVLLFGTVSACGQTYCKRLTVQGDKLWDQHDSNMAGSDTEIAWARKYLKAACKSGDSRAVAIDPQTGEREPGVTDFAKWVMDESKRRKDEEEAPLSWFPF